MIDAIGIVNFEPNNIQGLSQFRTVPAMTFIGRYRIIDFVLSNMSNSGIEQIKVLCKEKPASLMDHLGNGTQYNINSKKGYLQLVYPDNIAVGSIYTNDIYLMEETVNDIIDSNKKYVVISPSYMICRLNYQDVIREHEKSGADITCVYKKATRADIHYIGCMRADIDKDGRITDIRENMGVKAEENILMETYVMTKETYVKMIENAKSISPLFSFKNILATVLDTMNIRAYQYEGYLLCINSLQEYFNANMDLVEYKHMDQLFDDLWPIMTRTNDSVPAFYAKSAKVKNCLISNGCQIHGSVENCIVGRGVHISKGAVVKNAVLLANSYIAPDSHLEYVVVDKHARIENKRDICGTEDQVVYIRRRDRV